MVTGISTGALTAPFAFLGAKYDDVLKKVYTTTSTKDILKERGIFSAAFGDSMADTTPMKALIARYVTADMVSAIAHKALSKGDPSRQALTSWIDASVRRSELLTVCRRAGLDVKSRESKRSMLNRLTQLQHLRVLDACRLSELRRLARRESLRTSGTRVEVITELVFGLHNGWAPVAGLRA